MAARKGLVLSLGFDAQGAFDEMAQSFDAKLAEMKAAAQKAQLGKEFNKQFEDLEKKVEQSANRISKLYDQMQKGKIDTKVFDAFTEKVTSDFNELKLLIDDLYSQMSGGKKNKAGEAFIQSFEGLKTEFKGIQEAVTGINKAFGEVITLSSQFSQNIEGAGASSGKAIKKIREYYDQVRKQEKKRDDYASKYRGKGVLEATPAFDDSDYRFVNTSDETDFRNDYNARVQMLNDLVSRYKQLNITVGNMQKAGNINNDDYILKLSERAEAIKQILDYYAQFNDYRDLLNQVGMAYQKPGFSSFLEGNASKNLRIMEAQLRQAKNTISSYLDDYDTLTTPISQFSLKDGAIQVPVNLDLVTSTNSLINKIQQQIEAIQKATPTLNIPVALKGVTVRGQSRTLNTLKAWGYDFDEAKDAISSNIKQMSNAVAAGGTPDLDLGSAYTKAYLDSLHFASNAVKVEVNNMRKGLMENGGPIKIPLDFDFEQNLQKAKEAIRSIGTDAEGNAVPLFDNLSVPDEMRNQLSQAGQTAANSWQNGMLSSIGVVASAFQNAMSNGLRFDNSTLASQFKALRNQLSMLYAPEQSADQKKKDYLEGYARQQFSKAYKQVKEESAAGTLYNDAINALSPKLTTQRGYLHYFEETFESLRRLKSMGVEVNDILASMITTKSNAVTKEDAEAIGGLFQLFQTENPIPDNISTNINSIVTSLNTLRDTLEEVRDTVSTMNRTLSSDNFFNFDIASIDQAIPKLNQMIDLFTEMNRSFTLDEMEAQWIKVKSAFNKIDINSLLARGSKKATDAQKEQFESFEREYQKYLKMGGSKNLTQNLKYEKDENYAEIQEQYIAEVEKANEQIGKSMADMFTDAVGTSGVDGANQWRDAMLEAIGSVKKALQEMFMFQSNNKIYDFLKGWTDADKLMRANRKGGGGQDRLFKQVSSEKKDKETGKVIGNAVYEQLKASLQPANGELERAAFFNSKTGKVSNAYTVDQRGGTNAHEWMRRNGLDIRKYDTDIHSHPLGQGQDYKDITGRGLKSIGHNLGFSAQDLKVFLDEFSGYGIKKFMVESNGMLNQLDFSGLSQKVVQSIINKYTVAMNSPTKTKAYAQAKNFENMTFDYDIRDKYFHEAMQNAIRTSLIEQASSKGKTLNPDDIDMSKYYKQFSIEQFNKPISENGAVYIDSLANSLHSMSVAMSQINANGGFDFKFDASSFENLDIHLQSIVQTLQSLKQNFELTFGDLSNPKFDKLDALDDVVDKYSNDVDKFREQIKAGNYEQNDLSAGEYFENTFRAVQRYQTMTGDKVFKNAFEDLIPSAMKDMNLQTLQQLYNQFSYENPIPKNFAQSLNDAIASVQNITKAVPQGQDGNIIGLSADSISQINSEFQSLSNTLKQISESSSKNIADSMTKVSDAIDNLSGKDLALKPETFSEINTQLENMLHLFEEVYGVYSKQTLGSQWNAVEQKFKIANDETINLEARKKALDELTEAYQRYLDMGGKRQYSELAGAEKTSAGKAASKESLDVMGALSQITKQEQAPREYTGGNIGFNIDSEKVLGEVQKLLGTLQKLTQKPFDIKLNLPSVDDFSTNITNLLSSLSNKQDVGNTTAALNDLAGALERINQCTGVGGVFDSIKSLADSNTGALTTAANALERIATSLSSLTLSQGSTDFFANINKLMSDATTLSNLATVLKANQTQIKAAGAASGQAANKPKTKTQQSNELYSALTSRYSDILKQVKSKKRGMSQDEIDAINQAIVDDNAAITGFESKLSADKDLFNAGKNEKIEILKQQIQLEEQLATIRQNAARDAADEREIQNKQRLLEVTQALAKDTQGWQTAIEALQRSGAYAALGDIQKIDRRVRRDEKSGEYYVSYRATDAEGNSRTVGMDGKNLMDTKVAANPKAIYGQVEKHLQNILDLRLKLAQTNKNEQPRTYTDIENQLSQEKSSLTEVISQAKQLQNLVPEIMTKIGQLARESGRQTREAIQSSLNGMKDSMSSEFKGIEKEYGDVLKNAPDLKNQLQKLRLDSNGATSKTELDAVAEEVANIKENLKALAQVDVKNSGWEAMIKSIGDVSSIEEFSRALDSIQEKIIKYLDLTDKLKSGKSLSLQDKAQQKQLESDINAQLKNLKAQTRPETEKVQDTRKDIVDRAKLLMKERSDLKIEQGIIGSSDPGRIADITNRLQQLRKEMIAIRGEAANFDTAIPGSGLTAEIDKMYADFQTKTQQSVQNWKTTAKNKLMDQFNQIKEEFSTFASDSQFKDVFTNIQNAISGISTKSDIPKVTQQLKDLKTSMLDLDKANVKAAGWTDALNELDATGKIPKFRQEIDDLMQKIQQYRDLANRAAKGENLTDAERSQFQKLSTDINKGVTALQKNTGGRYNLSNKQGEVNLQWNNVGDVEHYYQTLAGIDAASMKITTSNEKVSASYRMLNGDLVSATASFDSQMGVWRQVISTTTETANIFDRIGASIKNSASYFRSYFSGYMVAQKVISSVRNAITTISDLDHQFAEMQKVSQDSYSALREYADGAYDMAQRLGSTTSDILNSTVDFLRIGQSVEQAGKSAETAAILKNVSQYENISDATDSLIAMEQAYKDVDPMSIVDKLNLVGDRFAISTDELADGMKNAGSTLSLLGNSIDDTAALLTSANTVIQDISKVSSGMRTIALRVVGTEEGKAKLEEDGEDTSNKQGVDILDENGNYKTTYEYMRQISKVYKEIQEQDKKFGTNRAVALIEELAGKNRSNIASAILSNPELLEQVKNTSQNSALLILMLSKGSSALVLMLSI